MSSSSEPVAGARALRVAGVITLLLVQGTCLAALKMVGDLGALQKAFRPSREIEHARLASLTTCPSVFPVAVGYAEHFDGDTLVMMTATTRRRVRMDAYTAYFTPEGPARASDLRPGAGLTIGGAFEPDGTLLADVVVIRPAP